MSMVAVRCPNCGAGLSIDTTEDVATCDRCDTRAFVKTRGRPVTSEIAEQYPMIIDASAPSSAWRVAIGLGLALCTGGAAAYKVAHKIARREAAAHTADQRSTASPTRAATDEQSKERMVFPEMNRPSTGLLSPDPAIKLTPSPVRLGALTVSGGLDAGVVQPVIERQLKRLGTCHAAALRTSPALAGHVTVRLVIDGHGSVASVSKADSDLPNPEVIRCVLESFHGSSFPVPESGSVTVLVPLTFSP
jgi:DNA-directed RNA polymerase subunit RPC12/RpoP